jgi:hypothetical protein
VNIRAGSLQDFLWLWSYPALVQLVRAEFFWANVPIPGYRKMDILTIGVCAEIVGRS